MLGLTLEQAKRNFFDRKAVLDAMDKATHAVLSRFGAYVRQRAKTSLKYRDRPSAPGSPPSVHRTMVRKKRDKKTGTVAYQMVSPLREFVFFVFDRETRSVVIGPALLNGKGGASVLAALEYGGQSVIHDGPRKRTVTIRARPFMVPAFEAELRNLPDQWKGSLHRRR